MKTSVMKPQHGFLCLLSVVKEVVRQVIGDVTKDTSTVYGCRGVPVVKENEVHQFPEWRCKSNK